MRLLNVNTLEFKEFFDDKVPLYAILSHRWGDDEVSYQVFSKRHKEKHKVFLEASKGYRKILSFCEHAAKLSKDGSLGPDVSCPFGSLIDPDPEKGVKDLEWVWIDTCCVDKSSSAELSEAINSMYRWYEEAAFCCVYLADVDTISCFAASEWFKRGWTLQELLAPAHVIFMNPAWAILGTKDSLCDLIVTASRISKPYINGKQHTHSASVAERFSWASRRTTSRIEDEAYSLLGLFEVQLPLLYGEGHNAFRRLQEELLRVSTDDSVFAWSLLSPPESYMTKEQRSVDWLAHSPASFYGCETVTRTSATLRKARARRSTCQMTRWGIQMDVAVIGRRGSSHSESETNPDFVLVRLNCNHGNSRPVLLGLCLYHGTWYVFERNQQAIQNALSPELTTSMQNDAVKVGYLSIFGWPYLFTSVKEEYGSIIWVPVKSSKKS